MDGVLEVEIDLIVEGLLFATDETK